MKHAYTFAITHYYHPVKGVFLMDDFGNAVSAQGMLVNQWVHYISQTFGSND